MSGQTSRELKLEIAHVLFIDIVGYSKLLHNEQSEVLRELNDIVRSTEQFRAADAAGALLRLPTGDGVALIFRNSPEAPAQCALEIAEALKSRSSKRCGSRRRTRIFESPWLEGWGAVSTPSSRPGSRISQGEAGAFGARARRTGITKAAAMPIRTKARAEVRRTLTVPV